MRSVTFILAIFLLAGVLSAGEPTQEVKDLLITGIQTYVNGDYTEAIKIFEKVQKIDPQNELAEQYIQSSRQRLSEIEFNPELAKPQKRIYRCGTKD